MGSRKLDSKKLDSKKLDSKKLDRRCGADPVELRDRR